jgi:hypothetical protein
VEENSSSLPFLMIEQYMSDTTQRQPHKYAVMLAREKKTAGFMISIYCKHHHCSAGRDLCVDCKQVKDQVFMHLEKCPSQKNKTACGRCGLKCYPAASRVKVWTIMSYSGPRMLLYHPGLALQHLWDARRAPPKIETKTTKTE